MASTPQDPPLRPPEGSPSRAPRRAPGLDRSGRAGSVLALLCAVQFVDVLGVTSATTAIPAIAADLAAGPVAVTGLATAYAASFGALLVLAARAGDRWGHRRVLLVGLVAFAGVGLLGACAVSPSQVVLARALQGAAAAVSIPSALRLLLDHSQFPARRTAAIAAWSAAAAAAGAAGFLVGGALTEWLTWRALFGINVPVGLILAVLLAWRLRPPVNAQSAQGVQSTQGRSEDRGGAPAAGLVRLDGAGALLLATVVVAVVVGAALLESSATRGLGGVGLLVGVGAGAGLVLQQRRAVDPLIPAQAVRSANLRLGAVLSFANTATTSSSAVLLALYLQQHEGLSPLRAGLMLVPLSLAVVAGSAVATPVSRWLSQEHLAGCGLGLVAAGNVVLALAHQHTAGVLVGVVLIGAGLGPASVAATGIGTSVPAYLGATASGVINTAAQVGTAVGVATLLTVVALVGGGAEGAVTGWLVIAVGATAVAFLCARRRRADLPC